MLKAEDILDLLQRPTADVMEAKFRIWEEAEASELVRALQHATHSDARRMLCEILGKRCVEEAVPDLMKCVADPSHEVRLEAEDALGRIGDPAAGPVLYMRLAAVELDRSVRLQLTSALGACGHRPAIPLLIGILDDEDPLHVEFAAWSLGILAATEAEDPLTRLLERTPVPDPAYFRRSILDALTTIRTISAVSAAVDEESALSILLPALSSPSNTLRGAAAWSLGALGLSGAVSALRTALEIEQSCFVAHRLRGALASIIASSELPED